MSQTSTAVPYFKFLLRPEFPLNAVVLATEALRIANQNSGRELFRWSLVSEDGAPVRASNGMWLDVDQALGGADRADFYLVFEGNLPTQRNTPRLLNELRAARRFGATIGAVDTGAFALAQAGLLGAGETVVHWEAVATFRERFPQVKVSDAIYLVDSTRISCAGGVATLDMMLDLIERLASPALANEVANALVHTPRTARQPQRNDAGSAREKRLLSDRIVALMEGNLDFPLSLEDIAERLGVSSKTVVRECHRRFDDTPMRLYLKVRLQAARNMLFYEEFGIGEVATACGFSYPAVFSRAFKEQFGTSPREFRAALRRQQNQAFRPEIRRLSFDVTGERRRAEPVPEHQK